MQSRTFLRAIVLGAVTFGFAVWNVTTASAQMPQPEAELIAAGYKRLSGQEASTLLVGNTTYALWLVTSGPIVKGTTITLFWRDAKTRLAMGNDKKKVEAHWWIENDKVCNESKVVNPGHNCTTIVRRDFSIYWCNQSANCTVVLRVVPGNPDSL